VSVGLVWDVVAPADITSDALQRAAQAALSHGGRADVSIDLVVVSDAALAELHERYLDDDSPTDVMAFDLGEEHGGPAGEVYISLDCAQRVAQSRGVALQRELALYVVHGCLHLCGFDDNTQPERVRMREAEALVLSTLGYAADVSPHEHEA
jgi:probable rRNA maturation factor